MKKLALTIFALALVVSFAGRSMAADTANVTVSATVLDTCLFTTGGDLSFGGIDPSAAGPYLPVVTDATVECSAGTSFTITDDGGLNGGFQMDDVTTGAERLPYNMTYDAGPTVATGWGSPDGLNIDGSITQAAAQGVLPDDYDDTVVLSILP